VSNATSAAVPPLRRLIHSRPYRLFQNNVPFDCKNDLPFEIEIAIEIGNIIVVVKNIFRLTSKRMKRQLPALRLGAFSCNNNRHFGTL
jgi:hypothetical protein